MLINRYKESNSRAGLRPQLGGEMANRCGLPIARLLAGRLLDQKAVRASAGLGSHGFTVYGSFLARDAVQVADEVRRAIHTTADFHPQDRALRATKISLNSDLLCATANALVGNRLLTAAVHQWYGRSIDRSNLPGSLWRQEYDPPDNTAATTFWGPGATAVPTSQYQYRDTQDQWHSDLHRPVLKLFYYPFGCTAFDLRWQYLEGSQALGIGRMREEYFSSLPAARERMRLGVRTVRVTSDEQRLLRSFETYSTCLPPDSAVLADTSGYHRRSPTTVPASRVMIVLSFKSFTRRYVRL